MMKRLSVTNLVGFLALNVVSGAISIVCWRAFKLTRYLTYIFTGVAPKIICNSKSVIVNIYHFSVIVNVHMNN